ncbi:2-amino-4-hydroxy-6-hydroxymethyldihydropteridine diphosphokinase [Moheibacter sediminis]|uniref:2-amino-4-hydroxy-6-hydroxymethyldihydropteridine pyrophosphokinase n=1 Tax=Moheibacter sediminis TaxID=1434700 RepID=A0A1W2C258_9FLAO|nr:2-amino-4-hydroxy-6-hydroxymethyldihydropteridine diphosphokinase [Moheibacter sediminis]SMC78798.1 2-amino-4-hydroxy-6-hydroxymethyldihydropteridinediphosphokinase [Moheibacter sediminis]
MSHNQVILLLGTNLGDKNLNLQTAQELIGSKIGEITRMSEIIETEPVGFDSENNFLNQTLWISTEFSPMKLLTEIKLIENDMGRIYTRNRAEGKYEDRIIDIDILIFNSINFESKTLKLPHNQIFSRNFVKKLL